MILTYIALALVVVNAAILGWNFFAFFRVQRVLRHAHDLDQLLGRLCVQVYSRQHEPVWRAWAATMGSIEVEINQKRILP